MLALSACTDQRVDRPLSAEIDFLVHFPSDLARYMRKLTQPLPLNLCNLTLLSDGAD